MPDDRVRCDSRLKALDKLSSTGYGYVKDPDAADGAPRQPVPIPSEQKLKDHEARESHAINLGRLRLKRCTGRSPSRMSSMLAQYEPSI